MTLSVPLKLVVVVLFALVIEMCDIHHVKTVALENHVCIAMFSSSCHGDHAGAEYTTPCTPDL